jgi:hypothetical protein
MSYGTPRLATHDIMSSEGLHTQLQLEAKGPGVPKAGEAHLGLHAVVTPPCIQLFVMTQERNWPSLVQVALQRRLPSTP